ncbi:hypothetical protein TrVE_jg5434 [Triparma verrucosa]|uniref:50S ribosomal protein L10 n=2 Tax=Triparma TaxID=722752 RepID=A0A9W7E0L9_9STRA|nr:hypothetical protein TrST_g275 [Triparma strigata]GMI03784.1 hypothetical protein TrVE_jg5434 [Triparma verrucosa]
MYRLAIFFALIQLTSSFSPHFASTRHNTALFGGAKGGATTMEGKTNRVAFVKDKLSSSEMIFSIPSEGLTVSQSSDLRSSMPEGTTVALIKNTLMTRAIADTGAWESSGEMLKGTNMWFFIESDIKGTLTAFKKFQKENDKAESNPIQGGVIDGDLLDLAGVKQVGELPSKKELIARIAGGLNMVPTKVAKVVKAPSSKLARAIQLATEEKKEE